ncbi:hypothetical protein [Varibaculum cambriense]|uniref:hypothetical protein n=1 Tax=Varibaculum cambriense TaxID=184870 RepID=UPI0029081E48|nr:hypothetical protein [Varibaculum cambriense]MDU5542487.1 hypothetical protein [Varibaculum cambriense]
MVARASVARPSDRCPARLFRDLLFLSGIGTLSGGQGIAVTARDLRVRRGKYLAEVSWRHGSEEYSGQAEAGLGIHLSKKQSQQKVGLKVQQDETCVVPLAT